MPARLYIIAGEASGDMHASNMMRALRNIDAGIAFRFWGGDNMKKIEPDGLVKHIRDLAFMGFVEVLMNIRVILKNLKFCKQDILAYKPDAIILVDYPGFNLRIAEWAKQEGIPVHYYISPQIWAWKESRVHKIKKFVDHMYVILPFEKEFYARYDMEVEFVGHPLVDAIAQFREEQSSDIQSFRSTVALSQKPIIALLPGSRKQEIKLKLPVMLEAIEGMEEVEILVAGAPAIDQDFYRTLCGPEVNIVYGQTYALLANASFALVTSGTATLETALFRVPEVVCYKGSSISFQIAKRLIKVKYISLVNLIMDQMLVKELIQHECNAKSVRQELDRLMSDEQYRNTLINNYDLLIQKLGDKGASARVAQSLLKTIQDSR